MRVTGIVKWWNDSKGYGFITVGEKEVFAHYTAVKIEGFVTLAEGQTVTLEVIDGPKGPTAAEVRPEAK